MRHVVRKQAVKSRVAKIQVMQKLGMKELGMKKQSARVLRASNLQQAAAQVVEKRLREGELVKVQSIRQLLFGEQEHKFIA